MADKHPPPHSSASPLTWSLDTALVPANGCDEEKTASTEERAALAAALNLLSCDKLTASWRVRRTAGDGFRVRGKINADVVQPCVVTLAPVYDTIATNFIVEFVTAAEAQAKQDGAIDLDDDAEIEPIEAGMLCIGRVVFEEVSASLNPYPRRAGAEYAAPQVPQSPSANNPFAGLAKLKTKPDKSGH